MNKLAEKLYAEMKERQDFLYNEILEFKIFDIEKSIKVNKQVFTYPDLFLDSYYFEVIKNSLYFALINGKLLCIYDHTYNMGNDEIDKDIRSTNIESISFERFIEVAPDHLKKRYLYHMDFFLDNLEVIKL